MTKVKLKKLAICTLVLVMCVTTAFQSFTGAASVPEAFEVFENGESISEAIVRPLTSRVFTANTEYFDYSKIQWQIYSESVDSLWVNISGQDKSEIEVSYAMIKNVLSDNRTAIRCVLLDENNEIIQTTNTVNLIAGNAIENGLTGRGNYVEEYLTNNRVPLKAVKSLKAEKQSLFTITIEYLYDTPKVEAIDKTAAYQPYIRTIVNNPTTTASVSIEEAIPQIKGFDTYVKYPGASDSQIVKADTVSKVFENLSENKVITVYYRPAEVVYHYRIFLQNTSDDNYPSTPAYTGDYIGITFDDTDNDAIIQAYADKTKGFIAVPSQNLQIAADGSTIVNLYFERLYYIVLFNVGQGGFGTDAVYAKYDQSVAIADPTRPGYIFKGWASKADAVTPDIYTDVTTTNYFMLNIPIPPSDESGNIAPYTLYYAVWETTMTNYTVIYWLENANDFGYEYGGHVQEEALSGSVVSGATAPKYNGTDSQHFKYFAARSDGQKIVEGDGSTVLNVYYVRTRVEVRFNVSGKSYSGHTHDALNSSTTSGFTADATSNQGCYILDCIQDTHKHTAECLTCKLTEHVHTTDCCSIAYHDHAASNCTINCKHTHNKQCYGIANNAGTSNPDDEARKYFGNLGLTNGCIYYYQDNGLSTTDNYYLYFNNSWYKYSSKPTDYMGSEISHTNCSDEGNYHRTDYFYKYNSICLSHSHTDACYTCGKTQHTHSSGCNYSACKVGYEHTHIDSCYGNCTKAANAHKHTADCYRLACVYHTASASNTYGYYDVKYGADLALTNDKNGKPVWDNSEYVWKVSSSGATRYTAAPTVKANLTVYSKDVEDGTSYIHYYENGKTDFKIKPDYAIRDVSFRQLTQEDYIDIPGFEYARNSQNSTTRDYSIYYNRLSFKINYMDGFSNEIKSETVPYETDMASYMAYVPTGYYPASLEKDMYVFDGWYLDSSLDPSTKFDMSNPNISASYSKMPAHDIILFAKWKPIQHKVIFYADDSLDEKITEDERGAFVQPDSIDHNSYVSPDNIPVGIKKKNLTFAGWFYYAGKTLKPFDPYNMPVTRDLALFPAWSSSTIEHYAIYYKLRDGTTEGKEIALPTTGILPSGSSVVFYAKGEPQWYPEIAETADLNYFPEVSSHTLEIEAGGKNEFTFWYVGLSNVGYTIKYTNEATGLPMDGYPDFNGVTTETVNYFKAPYIKGYLADAFEKRMIATANPEDNVVEFFYIEDSEHAYCHIEYEYQNTDLETYTKLDWLDYLGVIGVDEYNMSDLIKTGNTTGFHINLSESTLNGTKGITLTQIVDLPEEGADIVLKYDRDEVGYTVVHKIQDGDVIETEDLSGFYGVTVYPEAKDYNAYTVVGAPTKQLILDIDETKNVTTFEYTFSNVQIKYYRLSYDITNEYYEIVAPTSTTFGGGAISSSADSILALGGTPEGSKVLSIGTGYRFMGWYIYDDDGDIVIHTEDGDKNARLVDSSKDAITLSENGTMITPTTTKVDDEDVYVSESYFALFAEYATTLTIEREDLKDGEELIYHIVGKSEFDDTEVDIYVTVNADNPVATIVELPIGTYTISEDDDWSWRHSTSDIVDEKITSDNNEFVISGKASKTKWRTNTVKKVNDFVSED